MTQAKNLLNSDTFHELQMGTLSVFGRSPLKVITLLKEIDQKSGFNLFANPNLSIQILLEGKIQDYDYGQNRCLTLIMDPKNPEHRSLSEKNQNTVSWFSIDDLPFSNYRGTFFKSENRELVYTLGKKQEAYLLPSSVEISRELAAAICCAREAGINQDVIRLALNLKPQFINREFARMSLIG